MLSIDEAIAECKENDLCQIAEWLEELKEYKQKPEGWMWDEAERNGYNKGIDDAKSVILQTLDNEILVDTLHLRLEQLKAGGADETVL